MVKTNRDKQVDTIAHTNSAHASNLSHENQKKIDTAEENRTNLLSECDKWKHSTQTRGDNYNCLHNLFSSPQHQHNENTKNHNVTTNDSLRILGPWSVERRQKGQGASPEKLTGIPRVTHRKPTWWTSAFWQTPLLKNGWRKTLPPPKESSFKKWDERTMTANMWFCTMSLVLRYVVAQLRIESHVSCRTLPCSSLQLVSISSTFCTTASMSCCKN